MKILRRALLLLLLVIAGCNETSTTGLEGVKWISVSEDLFAPNQWICFRKNFDLKKEVGSAQFYIAVDSKYWLWINGELVVFEGGLKRGPNPDDTYCDKVDIAPYLKQGENTIALLMWYFGKEGFCHKDSGKPGLLARLSLENKQIASDETWKVSIHPAYGETGEPYPNYRLPESNIRFDARNDIKGWEMPGFDDTRWASASVLGTYPCQPWNLLHERPFPNWYDSGIVEYEAVSQLSESGQQVVTGKLPRNISITPYIKLRSKSGELIDIRSDNYKGGSEYNVRAEYITAEGEQEFEAFNYINGHSVIYTLPQGVEVLAVGYRETRFPTQFVGKFECSDDFFNRLWMKSLNTMNMNIRDAIQDPDRERSQWWGDAVIVSGEMLYSCDGNAHKLINKAIRNLVDWQKPDGELFSPIPAGSWDKELPAQMLASIGKYGFWNYYFYTGDKELMAYVYPSVKKYLALWALDERGLVVHREGGWDWLDWGDKIDAAVMDNGWYSLALESAANMALLLGYEDDAREYSRLREAIKQAVNAHLWNGKVYHSPGYTDHTDDRGNGLAILAGFTDCGQSRSIHDFLNGYANASPYMEKYVLESYFVTGNAAEGLARMKDRYRYMVNHELSTLWEDWQIGGAGGGSINHGWAGGPLILLSKYVGGVAPLEPGWQSYMIKPQPGGLSWARCTVPVGSETIETEWNRGKGRFTFKVRTTLKNNYIVAVPLYGEVTGITINGEKIAFPQMKSMKGAVRFEKIADNYLYLSTKQQNLTVLVE